MRTPPLQANPRAVRARMRSWAAAILSAVISTAATPACAQSAASPPAAPAKAPPPAPAPAAAPAKATSAAAPPAAPAAPPSSSAAADGRTVIPAPPPAGAAPAAASAPQKLKPEQLEPLVAPLALYPDPLLGQVLVASTYPLEIIEAQQWLAKNSTLKGDALVAEAQKQAWDPSVQSLVAFPDVMKRLSENIKWTTDLGDAFLAQQSDVMDAIQRLRLRAKESGKLTSTEQQTVTTKVVEKETVVVIEPAKTEVVYVPVYDPALVWGPPVYPYPPIYYPPPPPAGAMLISFGVGMMVGAAIHGGWGYGCGWGHHNNVVVVNHHNTVVRHGQANINVNQRNSNWQHNPSHRRSVPYANSDISRRYGGANQARPSTLPSVGESNRYGADRRGPTKEAVRGGPDREQGRTDLRDTERGSVDSRERGSVDSRERDRDRNVDQGDRRNSADRARSRTSQSPGGFRQGGRGGGRRR